MDAQFQNVGRHYVTEDHFPPLTPGEENLLSLYGLHLVRLNEWAIYARPAHHTDNHQLMVFDRTTSLDEWIKLAKNLGL